jgi:hypothetical protein
MGPINADHVLKLIGTARTTGPDAAKALNTLTSLSARSPKVKDWLWRFINV